MTYDKQSERLVRQYETRPKYFVHPFPIAAFKNTLKIVNNGKQNAKDVFDRKILGDSNELLKKTYKLFMTEARLVHIIMHTNAKYQLKFDAQIRKVSVIFTQLYMEYKISFTKNEMKDYNYLDVYLLLCNTINDTFSFQIYIKFLRSYCRSIKYITSRIFKFIKYTISSSNNYSNNSSNNSSKTIKSVIQKLQKSSSNSNSNSNSKNNKDIIEVNVIVHNLFNLIQKGGDDIKNIENSILYSLSCLILLYEYFFISNPEFKECQELFTDGLIDMSQLNVNTTTGRREYFFKTLLFFSDDDQKYNVLDSTFYPNLNKKNILFLMQHFISNYLASPNQLIHDLIARSMKDKTIIFFTENPFTWIFNHNQQFRYNIMSYIWNTSVLMEHNDIFTSLFDRAFKIQKIPAKKVEVKSSITPIIQRLLGFNSLFSINLTDTSYKYWHINLYLYLKYTNVFLKNKGITFELKRLPYTKSFMRTSLYGKDLNKTILASWQTSPYRYTTTEPFHTNSKKTELPKVYNNLTFLSTCCKQFSFTGSRKINGPKLAMSSLRSIRPPTSCEEIHIFTYNGNDSLTQVEFDLEKRKIPKIFLKKIFVDIFKIELKKEAMTGNSTMSYSSILNYYDVSLNMNINTRGTRMPLYFPEMKRIYKQKNEQNLKDVCLCKNYDNQDYMQFIKIERGVIYLYEAFYNAMVNIFIKPDKPKNAKNVKQGTEYNKARTREQIEKIHKEIVNKVTKKFPNNNLNSNAKQQKKELLQRLLKDKNNAIKRINSKRTKIPTCYSGSNTECTELGYVCDRTSHLCVPKKGNQSGGDTPNSQQSQQQKERARNTNTNENPRTLTRLQPQRTAQAQTNTRARTNAQAQTNTRARTNAQAQTNELTSNTLNASTSITSNVQTQKSKIVNIIDEFTNNNIDNNNDYNFDKFYGNNSKTVPNKTPCEEKMEGLDVSITPLGLPYLHTTLNKEKNILKIYYHPRHTNENIATIKVYELDKKKKNKKDKEKFKLQILLNPLVGEYTMNYFIVMIIANLFWYCKEYSVSKNEVEKLFNVKPETLRKFKSDVVIFDRFDKLRIINDKMINMLDQVFTRVNFF